jgi:hypothetical protein
MGHVNEYKNARGGTLQVHMGHLCLNGHKRTHAVMAVQGRARLVLTWVPLDSFLGGSRICSLKNHNIYC